MTGKVGRDVLDAAAAEGVAPDGPLGRLVAALAGLGDRMDAAVAEAVAAVERRAKVLEVAREGAEAAAETARLAVADHKARADEALAALVEGLQEQIGTGVKDVLVIKQRVVGAQRIGAVAVLGAVAAVALMSIGAALMAWRDADAVGFHATCARALVFDAQGNGYCRVGTMEERRPTT